MINKIFNFKKTVNKSCEQSELVGLSEHSERMPHNLLKNQRFLACQKSTGFLSISNGFPFVCELSASKASSVGLLLSNARLCVSNERNHLVASKASSWDFCQRQNVALCMPAGRNQLLEV